MTRPLLEVADVLRTHEQKYRRDHGPSAGQKAVLRHLSQCRTAALGGHVDTCEDCGHTRISYNSCRDRHCPKCQNLDKAEWLEARRQRLLPVPYFHVVFTLPDVLNPLTLRNKRRVFTLLFQAAAHALGTVARDPQHLGGQLGFTAILHTWSQSLLFHPHLHCVVTGGGLSHDGSHWVPARPNFLFPVKVLARLFRGKFLAELRAAYDSGELSLAGSTASLREPRSWRALLSRLYAVDWVVYAKAPFGGPDHVFRYLGRYTHRVAISNSRLIALEHGRVHFSIRDSADANRKKTIVLDGVEFIRRFLLHVLPHRFVRIRHFGLWAGRNVTTKLARARELLPHSDPDAPPSPKGDKTPEPWWQRCLQLFGFDPLLCPRCGVGRLRCVPIPTRATTHNPRAPPIPCL